jgi:hypothetical protein
MVFQLVEELFKVDESKNFLEKLAFQEIALLKHIPYSKHRLGSHNLYKKVRLTELGTSV